MSDPIVWVAIVGTRHEPERPNLIVQEIARLIDLLVGPFRSFGIVSGGQRGIDQLAADYAKRMGWELREFREGDERGSFGQRCHARNQKVADLAVELIAFPCSHAKGTWNTVRRFEKRPGKRARVLQIECKETS